MLLPNFTVSLPHYISSNVSLQPVLGSNFGIYARHGGLRFDTDIAFYNMEGHSTKFAGSAKLSGIGVTDPDEFQLQFMA